ncbi:methionyl-tRNA formyltransferase [Vampirovibrio sp.]|uniref:methionyl-tRNA formyltransferase n=1 Tax=Vampirovibrio sp. TaxID=2717857 RepID=UPI0035940108
MSSHSAPIKIVFLGTPAFSIPALKALVADDRIEIAAVITQPDRPAGRGQKLTPPPIKTLADTLGLPVFQTVSIKKDEPLKAHLKSLAPDFLVTVAFGQILTQEVLDIPKMATVNAHASLLPEFRGANPIQQAILQGKSQTGITTMLTELGVDTGPMLLKHTLTIGPEETMGQLTERLSESAGPLLVDTLVGMVNGSVQPEVQAHELATHAPKCQKEDAILDWQASADQLQLKIRAFNPAPGAATFLEGERVKLLKVRTYQPPAADHSPDQSSDQSEEMINTGQPGQILAIIETGLLVQTGQGTLEILSLQPAGKKEMPARDWALGYFKAVNGTRQLGCFSPHQSAPLPA